MSMNNKNNIIDKNMEVNLASQGQGASVNENYDENNYNIPSQNLQKNNLELKSQNLSTNAEKTVNKISAESEAGDNLSLESGGQLEVNNSELASYGVSVGSDDKNILDNKPDPSVAVNTEAPEYGEQRLIVCEMVDDMCIMKVVEKEPNFNNIVENLPEKKGEIAANPKVSQNVSVVLNNNEKIECCSETKTSKESASCFSKNAEEDGTDRSPEKLVEEVTKLKISSEKNKPKETQSKVVVNIQSESLKSLMAYDGDSDSEHSDTEPQEAVDSDDDENNTNTKKTWRKNTDNDSGTSDSESDSSASTLSLESDSDVENSDGDSASVIDASDDGIRVEHSLLNKNSDKGAVKKKNPNILDMEEFLPPLPDLSKLNINVDEADFAHIGRVSAIISELVTVSANPGTPAFDLDSMLFIDDQTSKKPIGPIYDVIGPVAEPIYCVRFNSEKEVTDLGIKSGMKVYAVPKNDQLTKFVFVQELMKFRGSDASWLNDQETPSEIAEFSDDEKEREARRAKKTSTKRKLDDGSLERHRRYEKTMNQCNTLNTRVCKLMDAHKNLSKHIRPNIKDDDDDDKPPPGMPELTTLKFDPTVPPPGFAPPSFQLFSTSPNFGQSPSFDNSLSPYGSQSGSHAPFAPSMLFGHNYANEPPSPQSLYPPPARWSWHHQREVFRRPPRSNNPRSSQHNSDNYFTNNGRNFRGAGPSSSQPF